MQKPITALDPFSKIFNAATLPSADQQRLMAERLQARNGYHRAEYFAFRKATFKACTDLAEKIATEPNQLIEKLQALRARAVKPDDPITRAQLHAQAEELTNETQAMFKFMSSAAIDVPLLWNRARMLTHAESAMTRDYGLAFPAEDTAFLSKEDFTEQLLKTNQSVLEINNTVFHQMVFQGLQRKELEEKRAGWAAVFRYMAHGDPDSPGLSAPPRAQFKKRQGTPQP